MKYSNKKIMLKYSAFSIVLEVLGWLLLMAVLLIGVDMYGELGAQIPIRFNEAGEPLEWGVRESAMFHPIFAVLIYIIVTGAGVIVRRSAPPDTPCPRLCAVLNAIAGMKIAFLVYELALTYFKMSCLPVSGTILYGLVAACVLIAAVCALYIVRVNRRAKLI